MSDKAGKRFLVVATIVLTLVGMFGTVWLVLDGPRKNEAYLAVKAHLERDNPGVQVLRPTRITTADVGDDPRRVYVSVDVKIKGDLNRDVKIVASKQDDGTWRFIDTGPFVKRLAAL